MKKVFALVVLVLSFSASFCQSESELTWYSDLNKAQAISQATNRPIFAFFTGSDWCGWCHKLQRDVFAKSEFVAWAAKNVVLLELDFPRNKALPEQLAQQNYSLQQFFKVTGYPTIWLFSASWDEANRRFTINALGSLGYPGGAVVGQEQVKFLENANAILTKTN